MMVSIFHCYSGGTIIQFCDLAVSRAVLSARQGQDLARSRTFGMLFVP